MQIECKIERFGYEYWVEEDGAGRCSDWGRTPYFQAVGSSVRIDRPTTRGGGASYTHFRFYPLADLRDAEGDPCMLVVTDVYNPILDATFYPEVQLTGLVTEMQASDEVRTDGTEPGYRYAPSKDRFWTPSLVRITLSPAKEDQK